MCVDSSSYMYYFIINNSHQQKLIVHFTTASLCIWASINSGNQTPKEPAKRRGFGGHPLENVENFNFVRHSRGITTFKKTQKSNQLRLSMARQIQEVIPDWSMIIGNLSNLLIFGCSETSHQSSALVVDLKIFASNPSLWISFCNNFNSINISPGGDCMSLQYKVTKSFNFSLQLSLSFTSSNKYLKKTQRHRFMFVK